MRNPNIFLKSIKPQSLLKRSASEAMTIGLSSKRSASFDAYNSHQGFYSSYISCESQNLKQNAQYIPLFKDLLLSRETFSKKQHTVFWHNYLLRTSNTIKVIAVALSRMSNLESIELIKKNLLDEVGGPSVHDIHFMLLNKSYEILSKKFDLPLVTTSTADQSPLILKVTRRFIRDQNSLYGKSEASAIGASFAQETLALPMLQNIFAFSEKFYKPHLTTAEWQEFSQYFDVHLDGTEKRHAEDSEAAVMKLIDFKNIEEIIHSARCFDSIQKTLWRGIHLGIIGLDRDSLSIEESSRIPTQKSFSR